MLSAAVMVRWAITIALVRPRPWRYTRCVGMLYSPARGRQEYASLV